MSEKKSKFPELLRAGYIGKLYIKNRIVMAPMGTYLAARDGTITERLKSYYEARARGGAGLIVVEVAAVDHPRGRGMTRQIGISEDKFIFGLSELAESIHRHGAKAGIQLHHGGRVAAPFLSGGYEAVAPSVISLIPKELGLARELSVIEISQLVECFSKAAYRAKQAGIDGVEIHAGHGYLINQFLSRSTNRRQDNYGGSLNNRIRFLLEIITAIRQRVGADYPVWCRIDGKEYGIENGITQEESKEIACILETAEIDALSVSGYGGSTGFHFTEAPLVYSPCFLMPVIQNIKKAIKIPIIAAGRIDLIDAENILSKGQADFIAMGRPLLADSELPNKIVNGKQRDVRKCIYCYTCVHQIFVRNNICCAINPIVGKESEPPPETPKIRKQVLVVGGGLAGMTVAINAATRGHSVTLVEKENHLGGSLWFASIVRPENEELMKHLIAQVKKWGIRIKFRTIFNTELMEQMQPDTLVLATGSVRKNPLIPGIDNSCVIDGDILRQMFYGHLEKGVNIKLSLQNRIILNIGFKLLKPIFKPMLIRRLTHFWMPLGKKVIIIGAGMIGCELALFLAERGRIVTLVEISDQTAPEMPLPMKWRIVEELDRRMVDIITEIQLNEIHSRGLVIVTKAGIKRSLVSDNIIIATGAEPDKHLYDMLRGKATEILLAGDCNKLSYIKDSVADGARIGSLI